MKKLIKFINKLIENIITSTFQLSLLIFILINLAIVLSPIILAWQYNSLYYLLGLILSIPYGIIFIRYLKY